MTLLKNIHGVGIDMVEVSRFENILKNKQTAFLEKVFLPSERKYCQSHKDRAVHFAGLFAAKEAVSKALGVKQYPFSEIEICHDKDGKPVAYHRCKKLQVMVSITHIKKIASAIAIG